MIIEAARAAASRLLSPAFRGVLFKSLGLTVLVLIGAWFGLTGLFSATAMPWIDALLPGIPDWVGWFGMFGAIIAGVGLALALALLIAPVTAVVASMFLDEVAEVIETEDYPHETPGQAIPAARSLIVSLKFFVVVVIGNLFALILLLVPGINIAAFFLVNGYLLGREFFEFAAMRHRSEKEAKAMRSRHTLTIFMAGLVIAGFLSIPVVNLLTPLFASALMVHLHKMLSAEYREVAGSSVSAPMH